MTSVLDKSGGLVAIATKKWNLGYVLLMAKLATTKFQLCRALDDI